ncbi:MAG: RDD family protein [Tissierellia bacterium]|nr:RDD family protein [Tissierellia bacterium]
MKRQDQDPFSSYTQENMDPWIEIDPSPKKESDPLGQEETPEKPLSDFVVAGFWIRGVALLLDLALAWFFTGIFANPILALLGHPLGLGRGILRGFFFYLYFVLSTKFTNGQTLGKMILGLRVVHPQEGTLSWTTVLVREFFGRYLLQALSLIYLMSAFMPKKQHLVDFLLGTYVVKDGLYQIERDQPQVFQDAL